MNLLPFLHLIRVRGYGRRIDIDLLLDQEEDFFDFAASRS